MIAVITSDIINSTANNQWRNVIHENLSELNEVEWRIFRGDSLQIRIEKPEEALRIALILKSSILQISELDIRMAIGLGEESLKTDDVTENQGSAYVNSGRLFEELTQNLAIKTDSKTVDLGLNAGLNLFNTICEQWTPKMAEYVNIKLRFPNKNQEELSNLLKSSQPNVSRVLARANYSVLNQYVQFFQQFISSRS